VVSMQSPDQRREETGTPTDQAERLRKLAEQPAAGLAAELWGFLRHNKKWWLGPIILVLLLVGALLVLASSSLAPLIYPLF